MAARGGTRGSWAPSDFQNFYVQVKDIYIINSNNQCFAAEPPQFQISGAAANNRHPLMHDILDWQIRNDFSIHSTGKIIIEMNN